MKYNPKYKKGDRVRIYLPDELNKGYHIGEVDIVDTYGTWDNGNAEPSYDVIIHDYRHPMAPDKITECLCKHHTESEVKPVED